MEEKIENQYMDGISSLTQNPMFKYLRSILILIMAYVMTMVTSFPDYMDVVKLYLSNEEGYNYFINSDMYLGKLIFKISGGDLFAIDVITVVGSILVVLSLVFIYKKINTMEYKEFNKKTVLIIVIGILLMNVYQDVFGYILEAIQVPNTENQLLLNESAASTSNLLLFTLTTALFAPIVEEYIFRGFIFEAFPFKNKYIPLIISSLVFGYVHVHSFNLLDLGFYSGMGFIFGFAYMKTDNIYVPIILHTINNTLASLG